jgi:hypothetical protein
MGLFKDSKQEMAYVKASMLGFPGSGKTLSASLLAIGIHKFVKSSKPVAFLDTETGSDFVKKYFDRAEVSLKVAKTRAFVDLLDAVTEAEANAEILIIDSITHFWEELKEAYKKRKNKKRLTLQDWGEIKPEWAQFTEKYLNSKLHIVMLGRAGWEFDEIQDDEGAQKLTKTGTKMKVETDLGYEPSLAMEMEKIRTSIGKSGGSFTHRCWILKDRFNLINGMYKDFKATRDEQLDLTENNPVFQFLLPHIQSLNLGGEHRAIENRDSVAMFSTDRSAAEYLKKRDIAIEELADEIKLRFPGSDNETKKNKIQILKDTFGTSSWTAIQNMNLEEVIIGKEKIKSDQFENLSVLK